MLHPKISTQVPISIDTGLKHDSAIHCDELISFPKVMLTHYIGALSEPQILELNEALKIALALD